MLSAGKKEMVRISQPDILKPMDVEDVDTSELSFVGKTVSDWMQYYADQQTGIQPLDPGDIRDTLLKGTGMIYYLPMKDGLPSWDLDATLVQACYARVCYEGEGTWSLRSAVTNPDLDGITGMNMALIAESVARVYSLAEKNGEEVEHIVLATRIRHVALSLLKYSLRRSLVPFGEAEKRSVMDMSYLALVYSCGDALEVCAPAVAAFLSKSREHFNSDEFWAFDFAPAVRISAGSLIK